MILPTIVTGERMEKTTKAKICSRISVSNSTNSSEERLPQVEHTAINISNWLSNYPDFGRNLRVESKSCPICLTKSLLFTPNSKLAETGNFLSV
jgi:hypothetical protein